MKIKNMYVMSFLCLLSASFICARVLMVNSVHHFNNLNNPVTQASLLVALFYDSSKKDDSAKKKKNDALLDMYQSVSEKRFYDDADVTFARVNVAQKGFDELLERYGIKQLPSVIVFDKGRIMLDKNGKIAMLTGFPDRKELHAFIKMYGGSKIEFLLQKKEERRKQRIQDEKEESKPYFYPPADMTYEGTYWTRPLQYSE